MKKRGVALLMAAVFAVANLSGCGRNAPPAGAPWRQEAAARWAENRTVPAPGTPAGAAGR